MPYRHTNDEPVAALATPAANLTTPPTVSVQATAWDVLTSDGVTLGTVHRSGSLYRIDHDPDGAAYGTLSTAVGALLAARADR